ncbi:RHS repeat domain-containing protein [Silanimonas sp.]|jgi:YD repeat-containing protein|uniref:RHS repeat domain-containing protein n=1 Tax=Silanimonas sp. TaxID=1929290 RepID=UPI0037CB20F1
MFKPKSIFHSELGEVSMSAGVRNAVAAAFWALVLGGVSPLVSAQQYTYDSTGRLTEVVFSNGAKMQFTYDKAGNRLTEAVVGTTTAHVGKAVDSIARVDGGIDGAAQGGAGVEPVGAVAAGAHAVADDTAQAKKRPAGPSTADLVPGRDAANGDAGNTALSTAAEGGLGARSAASRLPLTQ